MNEKNYLKYIKLLEEQVEVLEKSNLDDVIRKEQLERNKIIIRYYTNKIKTLNNEVITNTVESGVGSIETNEVKNVGTDSI